MSPGWFDRLTMTSLASKGIASLDLDELDTKKLSSKKIKEFSKKFPIYTREYLKNLIPF